MSKEGEKRRKRQSLIRQLITLYGRKCWYCGQRIDEFGGDLSDGTRLNLEHVTPKSKGGEESLENLALACASCNRAKSGQDVIEFLRWLSHVRSGRFDCLILGKLPKDQADRLDGPEWDRLRKEFFRQDTG